MTRIANLSDADLASALRMSAAEQWAITRELTSRGYDVGCVLRYEDGTVKVEIDKVEKNAL